ncbi:hypothetical protein TNCV_3428171 [Trichonephila clavipes]|nr:hypothetical protein TNCV_3428171 [Trichonephila clavipes]
MKDENYGKVMTEFIALKEENGICQVDKVFKDIIVSQRRRSQPPVQPIGVNDHFTKRPTREQPLSSQSCQKISKISHPDEAR